MALQTTGQISLSDMGTEFSDSTPHSLSEFYGEGSAPSSGQISFSNLYGASSYVAQLLSGSPTTYKIGMHSINSVAFLTETKAIVCYTDDVNNYRGTACVLDISGNTITAGTPVVFQDSNSRYVSVSQLTANKAVVCFRDNGNSGYLTACLLDISGNTITAGTPVASTSKCYNSSINKLTDTQVVVCFQADTIYYGNTCILNISGQTLSFTSTTYFETSHINELSATTLTTTKVLVTYGYRGNSQNYPAARIIDISGNTVTVNDRLFVNTLKSSNIRVTALSDTKAVLCYRDVNNSYFGNACVLDISGSTITAGTPVVFKDANPYTFSCSALTDSKVVVCYSDSANNWYGTACLLNISGNSIIVDTPVVFVTVDATNPVVVTLSSSKLVVCYMDYNNNNNGAACVIDYQ